MNVTNSRFHGWGLDLLIVGVLTIVAAVSLLGPLHGSSVALVVGIPFLLVLPGYAIVAAVFPQQPVDQSPDSTVRRDDSPDWLVRIALSLLGSALVVGLVGLLLDWLLTISLVPFVLSITVVTFCGIGIAAERRDRQPPAHRADPFVGRTFHFLSAGTTLQSLALGIAIVALVAATVFVGVAPTQGEQYSEAYLLTENDGGELTAESYPSTFVAGEGHELSLALSNQENEPVAYEVVVVAQEVGPDGAVTAEEQVDRFGTTIDDGETTVLERQIAPTMTGDGIRLRFLVYEGSEPGNDAEADHVLQLWIDVEGGE